MEISPILWGLGFHIEIKKEIFENLLVPNCNCYSFDIWYVSSSRGPLPGLFIWCPWSQNWHRPGGHKLDIGTKNENFIILLHWNWKAWSFDILYVASPCWPLPSLFIWCPLGQNWPCPGDHKLEYSNKEAHLKNSSSLKLEGIEIWYLVCGISLWNSTKFVHMMPLGSKLAPLWELQVEHRNKERKFHSFSSLKLERLELWYFISSISLWTSTKFVHMMPLGSKLVPPQGVTRLNLGTKQTNFKILPCLKLKNLYVWTQKASFETITL